MSTVADNVRRVREQIAEAALRAGRKPEEIRLVAASKTRGAEAVREAVAAGVDACGENRVNEFLEKDALGAYEGAPKHFIGRLQHNTVRQITGKADLIQSVDSAELIALLEKRAALLDTVQPILLQVNIGREETKGGFPPEAADEAAAMAAAQPHLRLEGLMAIPPAWQYLAGRKKLPLF